MIDRACEKTERRSSRRYPTFNMAIPDQYRMDMFEEELRTRWESNFLALSSSAFLEALSSFPARLI